jgi:ADP-ribosylglycohydrolase
LHEFDSFEDGVIAVINKGGDADTNGAVTGALMGAKYGFNALPKRWVEGLVNLDRVIAAADGLYDLAAVQVIKP